MSNDYEQLSELGKRARERLQAITPGQGDATLPLDDKFMVARALMQEVAVLRDENRRLREAVYGSEWESIEYHLSTSLFCFETLVDSIDAGVDCVKRALSIVESLKGHAE